MGVLFHVHMRFKICPAYDSSSKKRMNSRISFQSRSVRPPDVGSMRFKCATLQALAAIDSVSHEQAAEQKAAINSGTAFTRVTSRIVTSCSRGPKLVPLISATDATQESITDVFHFHRFLQQRPGHPLSSDPLDVPWQSPKVQAFLLPT
jgi:hypothetical protein